MRIVSIDIDNTLILLVRDWYGALLRLLAVAV